MAVQILFVQSPPTLRRFDYKAAIAWSLYDFANTGFAMVVLALIWPQMFHHVWGVGLDHQTESIVFKLTQALPCLIIFFLAPFLGQLAERGRFRTQALRVSVVLGALLTMMLSWVPAQEWFVSALLYAMAAVAFFSASTFYDSMIVDCAPLGRRHLLSGIAYASGFVAGFLILILLALGIFSGPHLRWIYLAAGLWWLGFSVPLLTFSFPRQEPTERITWLSALQNTIATAKELWADERVRWFLCAYIFYIDGVHAVKTSAAHFGAVLGFGSADLVKAFLVVQIIGIPAALAFGWLGSRWGAVRMIVFALFGYVVLTLWGSQISPGNITLAGLTFPSVWLIAGGVGLVQGGVQALSRSYFAELVPPGREIVYFGFYSMMGKFAAFLGPLLGAVAGWLFTNAGDETSTERAGFASFALLFLVGLILLLKTQRAEKPKR